MAVADSNLRTLATDAETLVRELASAVEDVPSRAALHALASAIPLMLEGIGITTQTRLMSAVTMCAADVASATNRSIDRDMKQIKNRRGKQSRMRHAEKRRMLRLDTPRSPDEVPKTYSAVLQEPANVSHEKSAKQNAEKVIPAVNSALMKSQMSEEQRKTNIMQAERKNSENTVKTSANPKASNKSMGSVENGNAVKPLIAEHPLANSNLALVAGAVKNGGIFRHGQGDSVGELKQKVTIIVHTAPLKHVKEGVQPSLDVFTRLQDMGFQCSDEALHTVNWMNPKEYKGKFTHIYFDADGKVHNLDDELSWPIKVDLNLTKEEVGKWSDICSNMEFQKKLGFLLEKVQ